MKSAFIKKLRYKKNILITAMFFCLFAWVISGVYNYSARSMIHSEILNMVKNDSDNMSLYINGVLDETDRISSFLLTNSVVKNYIANGETSSAVGDIGKNLNFSISSYRYVYNYIHSMYLYSEANKNFFYDGNYNTPLSANDGWKDQYDLSTGDTIGVRAVNNNYPILLTFIRRTNLGGIIINIDVRKLADIIGDGYNEAQKKYIIDENGKIVYKYKIKSLDEDVSDYVNFRKDEKHYTYKRDGYIYAVAIRDIPGCEYRCVVENRIDDSRMDKIYLYTIGIILLLTAMGIMGSVLINRIAFNPLKKLVKLVDSSNDGRKNVTFENDEAKYVASKFMYELSVNEELRHELIRQMEISDKLKRYALGIQINPHFISSTLNLIHMNMAEKFGDNYDEEEILKKTSRCISYILKNSDDLVKLQDELLYSRMFVDILRIKCDNEVDISIEVAEDVSRDAKIIKLCINTLIENAFYHGISAKPEISGRIMCRIYRDGEDLVCAVSDDGVGMAPEEIAKIEDAMQSDDIMRNANIGLVNIESRIKMLFGEEYGITIKSNVGTGTEIIVHMPYQIT